MCKEGNQVKWRGIRIVEGEDYLPVGLTDGVTIADVNAAAKALYTSRAMHSRIEKSLEFMVSHRFVNVADEAAAEILLKVGATKNVHGNYTIAVAGKVHLTFYEAPVITLDGTALTEHSINREVIGVPTLTTFYTPTIAVGGTILKEGLIGVAGMFTGAGDIMAGASYWLLKKSQNYLILVVNKSGAPIDIAIQYNWHEK